MRKRNGASSQGQGLQGSLFDAPEENPPIRQAIDFYRHRHNWTNRLVAGDSLLVMNSLLEKEGLGGQVQMVYVDPPYGIRYGSNFQPFVHRQDVTDGRDEDLTGEPETIRAFRDTWERGFHLLLWSFFVAEESIDEPYELVQIFPIEPKRQKPRITPRKLRNPVSGFLRVETESAVRARQIMEHVEMCHGVVY